MNTFYLNLNPNYVNITNLNNPNIELDIDNFFHEFETTFPLGTYTIRLQPVAPLDLSEIVFTKEITLPQGSFLVTDQQWTSNLRGYYNIVVEGPNGYNYNMVNNKFIVYSYGNNSFNVAILPETFSIEPDVNINQTFTLYRLFIEPFSASEYTLTLNQVDCNTNEIILDGFSFTGSQTTNSLQNPIDITINNINLPDPIENYCFQATLTGANCNFEIINIPIEIQTLCFIEGTKILTETNGYIPIEKLEPGMLIKTFGSESFIPLKYLYKTKMTYKKTNKKLNKLFKYDKHKFGLIEDLIISGGHSILVNELTDDEKKLTNQFWKDYEKIDNKYKLLACIDSRNNEFEIEGQYNMYQIILESDDSNKQYSIDANGLLTETMSITFYTQHIKKNKLE